MRQLRAALALCGDGGNAAVATCSVLRSELLRAESFDDFCTITAFAALCLRPFWVASIPSVLHTASSVDSRFSRGVAGLLERREGDIKAVENRWKRWPGRVTTQYEFTPCHQYTQPP